MEESNKTDGIKYTVLFLVLLGILAGTAYYYRGATPKKENKVSEENIPELIAKVGKLIVLPENEIPTVATVSNSELLKDQPFFAKAKIGDRVLVYAVAKKVYLYDPIKNRIVDSAPIDLGNSTSMSTTTNIKSEIKK